MKKKSTITIAAAATLATVAMLAPTSSAATATGNDTINWQSCPGAAAGDTVRCGQLAIPIDWANPSASKTTQIQLARLPATQPSQRIGTLFFNPGGPGEGEMGYLIGSQARQYYFPQAIRDRFDIVAVEPRGTGENPPLNCPVPVDYSVTKFPHTQSEVAELVASNAKFGAQCVQAAGPISSHLDTASVARDMDQVRSALGESKISFLGVSYGTMLAQSYAELFPNRVRAMVIDGVVDRSLSWQRLVEADALAVQDGVDRFAQWCQATSQCALHNTDVHKAITQLLSRADSGQIKDQDRPVRAEEISGAINAALNDSSFYSPLATILHQVAATGAMGDLEKLTSAKNPDYPLYRAIICQDIPVSVADARQFPLEAAKVQLLAPTLRGYSEFWDIASGCAGWPTPARWTPHQWTVPASFPPVLLASGAHDVATPRLWAESVHRALPNSALVKWDSDGHAAWPANSASTVNAEINYLTNLVLPNESDQ